MNINMNKSMLEIQKHNLLSKNLGSILKDTTINTPSSNEDKVNFSKEALMKIRDMKIDEESEVSKGEESSFISLVDTIITKTLDYTKSEIEDSIKCYSSYINKIDNGTLKDMTFNEFADSQKEVKNDLTHCAKTDTALDVSRKYDPNKDGLSELQNRIKGILDKTKSYFNDFFSKIDTTSNNLKMKLEEIKTKVTSFSDALPLENINGNMEKEAFKDSLKDVFKNINNLQSFINNYTFGEIKNNSSLDKDSLILETQKYEKEAVKNYNRYKCDINLIDNSLKS